MLGTAPPWFLVFYARMMNRNVGPKCIWVFENLRRAVRFTRFARLHMDIGLYPAKPNIQPLAWYSAE